MALKFLDESGLARVWGKITAKIASDLTDYYTKNEVNNLISTIPTMNILIVEELPTEGISTTTIYLVPDPDATQGNAYLEYIYVSGSWELIGSTQVDLTNYYTKAEVDNLIESIGGNFETLTDTQVYLYELDTGTYYLPDTGTPRTLHYKSTMDTPDDIPVFVITSGWLFVTDNGTGWTSWLFINPANYYYELISGYATTDTGVVGGKVEIKTHKIENTDNKVTSISLSSTNTEYPSALAVYKADESTKLEVQEGFPHETITTASGEATITDGSNLQISGIVIHGATSTSSTITFEGKNLFAPATYTGSGDNGVVGKTTEGSSRVILNGVANSTQVEQISGEFSLPAGTYTASVSGLNDNNNDRIIIKKTSNNETIVSIQEGNTATFTTSSTANYALYVVLLTSSSYTNKEVLFQIEKGSSATAYEDYKVPQTQELTLTDDQLASGDSIYQKNGIWYKNISSSESTITDTTLLAQLENLEKFRTYIGTTNIIITSGELEFVYYKDLDKIKEDKSNKVTAIDSNSTDTQYPSAKAVYDSCLKVESSTGTGISSIGTDQSIFMKMGKICVVILNFRLTASVSANGNLYTSIPYLPKTNQRGIIINTSGYAWCVNIRTDGTIKIMDRYVDSGWYNGYGVYILE